MVLLDFNVQGCAYTFYLNSIPIFDMSAGHNLKFKLPVNEWVVNGKNIFEMKINPLPGSNIYETQSPNTVNIIDEENGNMKIIGSILIPSLKDLNKSPITTNIVYSIKFNFGSNLREHYWEKCQTIKNTEEVKLAIIKISNRFIDCFKKNKMADIIELMEIREKEMAYYYNENYSDRIGKLTEALQRKIENGDLKFEIINHENSILEYYFDNKIISLKRPDNLPSIIGYNNDIPITVFYPFYFCLNANNEFIIIK